MRLCTNVNYKPVICKIPMAGYVYVAGAGYFETGIFCTNEHHPTLSYQLADHVRIPAGNPSYRTAPV